MPQPIHKTGLWKTLGQKAGAISIANNLLASFVPLSSNWSDPIWTASLQSPYPSLRGTNGLTFTSGPPGNFTFDGTDDFLGPPGGYSGNEFLVDAPDAYTFNQWVYLPNGWGSGTSKTHYLMYFFEDSSNYVMTYIQDQSMKIYSQTTGGGALGPSSFTLAPNLVNNRNKWLYHTIAHNGSGLYKYYINGMFIDSINANYAPTKRSGSGSAHSTIVNIGKGRNLSSPGGALYTSADVKVGHIQHYDHELGAGTIRQNYLAIASPTDTRLYGDTTLV